MNNTPGFFKKTLRYSLLFAFISGLFSCTKAFSHTQPTNIQARDKTITEFMNTYKVPALSIAITKDEKLVCAKSYGLADAEPRQLATNADLYRISSLSKQITAATIFRLADLGRLTVNDKVFGPGAILGNDFGKIPYSKDVTDITIDELLHHTAGGWSNDDDDYGDPMFANPEMNARQLIGRTLDNVPLTYAPGMHYAYSNFGYCILGRVIEKVTGESYEQAAQALVLKPCGITDMRIAGNTLSERALGEVRYYGQNDEDPYSFNVKRMDACGGWIASATDVAKFMVHIDGLTTKELLSPESLMSMITGSAADPNYGCGIAIDEADLWHKASLPGTSAEMAMTMSKGNYDVVILTNTRSLDKDFEKDMNAIVWNSISGIKNWPDNDLFDNK